MTSHDLVFRETHKFLALGPTFRSHQKEIDRSPRWPDVWLVPDEAVVHEGEQISIPSYVSGVKPGVELTAVLGQEIWQASEQEAWEAVEGFTISNDVTATSEWPGWPESGRMKTNFGYKMFPTFSPVLSRYKERGPLETYDDLQMEVVVDGETSITGNTGGLHFPIPELISYVSYIFPLNRGDLIALGDPGHPDVFLDDAARVSCSIESLGTLSNDIGTTDSDEPPLK